MNLPLREVEADAAAPGPAPPPQVFVRVVVTPPGAPWEQARAAGLDAQMGAPMPIAELVHQVRRLDRWAPGRSGRYAAFYVRAREFREPFATTVEVDGVAVPVRFGRPARDIRRLQSLSAAALMLVLSGAVLGGGLMLALHARGEATAELDANAQLAAAKLKLGEDLAARASQTRDLKALVGEGRPLEDVVGDLTWIATSKTPEARIVGVHWERGLLAVEARGEQPPFLAVDRPIERSSKPLRPGVWLWAVGGSGLRQSMAPAAGTRP